MNVKMKKLLISVFGDFEISLRNIINCKSQNPAIKKIRNAGLYQKRTWYVSEPYFLKTSVI